MKYSEKLISDITEIFKEKFTDSPTLIFSPGRINFIGEHTDYNDGFVMPAAIDKGIYLAFRKNSLEKIRVHSYNFDSSIESNIQNLKPVTVGWANYVFGVVSEIQKLKSIHSGFDMVFGGDIPIGSGLSSSAALECGVGLMVNHLFGLNLDKIQIAKSGQLAEHNFVGVRCGIMDQFASIMGKADHAIQLDCRSLDYTYFPSSFGEYQILLCNSKVKHALAESSYNKRREECETGVGIVQQKYTQVKNLRDVTFDMLNDVRQHLSPIVYKRCAFVLEENQRVLEASKRLKHNELKEFGQLLFESHKGLSEKYEVSCPELDFLVGKAKDYPGVLGSRMMGGGFGGCTINLVQISEKEDFKKLLKRNYQKEFDIEPEFYEVELSNGTHIINQ